jgi:hypothetical protein
MFTRKTCVTFCVAVAFWLAATWYYAWYCDVTGRVHLAKIGLQNAGMVAFLGLYAFLARAGFAGSRYAPQRLRSKDLPGVWQLGLGVLTAGVACGLLALLFFI